MEVLKALLSRIAHAVGLIRINIFYLFFFFFFFFLILKKGMKLLQISYKVRLCFCLPNLALQTEVTALEIFLE